MPTFEPPDPDFQSAVRQSFERLTLMKTIGASLERVSPGEVEVRLPFRNDLTQHHGFMAAAVLTAVVDVACGYAAMSLMPPGSSVLTIEFKANFLAPAQGERMIARGRVIRPGRTLTVCAGDVVAVDGGQETIVATLLTTMMLVTGERPLATATSSAPGRHRSVAHSRGIRKWCVCRAWKGRRNGAAALV